MSYAQRTTRRCNAAQICTVRGVWGCIEVQLMQRQRLGLKRFNINLVHRLSCNLWEQFSTCLQGLLQESNHQWFLQWTIFNLQKKMFLILKEFKLWMRPWKSKILQYLKTMFKELIANTILIDTTNITAQRAQSQFAQNACSMNTMGTNSDKFQKWPPWLTSTWLQCSQN